MVPGEGEGAVMAGLRIHGTKPVEQSQDTGSALVRSALQNTESVSENGWTRRELLKRLKEAEEQIRLAENRVELYRDVAKALRRELREWLKRRIIKRRING